MYKKISICIGCALLAFNFLAIQPSCAAEPNKKVAAHAAAAKAKPAPHAVQAKAKPASHPVQAKAKEAPHIQPVLAKKAAAAHQNQVPVIKRSSGQIDTTKNGRGVYSTKVIHEGDKTIVDTTDKFADGKTVTNDTTYIAQKNGSFIKDSTTDYNGKISKSDEDFRKTGKGDYSITGKDYLADGKVEGVRGTDDRTKYGSDANMAYTTGGKTMDTNTEYMHAGNANAAVTTGTGFNGQAISGASLSVANKPSAKVIDTTANGHGTFSTTSVGNAPNQHTAVGQQNFNNGASSTNVSQVTTNGNGTKTVQNNYRNVSSQGTQAYGTTNETYTSNGNGGSAIVGTYNQSNGNQGTVNGAENTTAYGQNKNLIYTNQNGQTQTVNTQQLSVGGANLNVNSGSTYNGKSINNVALSTNGK